MTPNRDPRNYPEYQEESVWVLECSSARVLEIALALCNHRR